VIATLAILWAAVGVLALGWLLWTGRLGPRRTPEQRRAQRMEESSAVDDAEWIYGERARRTPRPSPQETEERARREAEAIVRDAELKARSIVAAAEGARREVVAELAREQADLAEKTSRLAEFLAGTLEEVERASANGSGTVSAHDLEQLEALQDELRGGE
jgi:vacuolar-type H+-ATPase subunit H